MLAFEVQHLAPDHAVYSADGAGNQPDNLNGGSRRAIEPGQYLKRAGLQRVTGEDGDGFTKSLVAGGLAAAQIVVVQGRQIVMNQRIGVKHLQGCAQPGNSVGQRARDGDRCLHGQHRAKALSPGERGVTHGAVNRGRNGFDAGNEFLERPVCQLRAFLDQRFHVGLHCPYSNRGRDNFRSSKHRAVINARASALSQRPARMSGVVVQFTLRFTCPCGTGTAMRPSARSGRF